ncbi:MYG1 exonuclease-like isoform X2 [Tubulanus polymorphus]
MAAAAGDRIKIGTHDGTFHCDEVFACYMLKTLPAYKNAEIIRSRKPEILETCDIVVDVGGVYSPDTHRYDHHQREFAHTMNTLRPEKKWTTKLSSAGLVYLHFGHRVIEQAFKTLAIDLSPEKLERFYDKMYEMFVEEIDAVDNGVDQYETGGKPRYAVTTTIGSRIGHLNPRWNEKEVDITKRFNKAMDLVGGEFMDRLEYFVKGWWPARTIVESAFEKRFQVDDSGEIVVLMQGGCPWKDHLFTIEEEQGIEGTTKFFLFADQNGNWRVQCVPIVLGSFENRLSLLEEWRGIRDDELSKISGIPGCIFVHASGFIGGNKTYEGVLEMARKTLAKSKNGC